MIILLEKNKYLEITLASIERHCSSALEVIVTDNVDSYIDENTSLTDPVFFIRGSSVKIVNSTFEKQLLQAMQENTRYFSVGKKYPGAYLKNTYYKAYEISGITDWKTAFDTDVMLVNPRQYSEHRNGNIWDMKQDLKVSLMSYGLNAKDDCLMPEIMESYMMLKRNVWLTQNAGLVNFSNEIIESSGIESFLLMPFELLHTYTNNIDVDISEIVESKVAQSKLLLGNIKESMLNVK
jgi:hypothetical protein